MPSGLRRFHDTGNTHFITFSCFDRYPYLSTPTARDLVVDGLARTQRRFNFLVYGFCIMPEHVHVLLTEPEAGTLAQLIKSWKLSVTLRQKHRPFWEERYYDFNVFTEKKRIEKLRYTHRNPVTRGLVDRPEDWPWSSFGHHASGKDCGAKIESRWTARLREKSQALRPGSEIPDPGHPSQLIPEYPSH